MASLKNYYDILGIQRGATEEEIERAYQKLARAYQVDSYSGNRAVEMRFREIAEAYAVLSDKEKRARYDQAGVNLPIWAEDRDFEWEDDEDTCNFEGFEEFISESSEKKEVSSRLPQRGKDLHHHLLIGFQEALGGTEVRIEVDDEVLCPECLGQGFDPRSPLETCRECGGAGHIQIGLFPEVFVQRCRRCQGWGRIRREPCPSCEGTKRSTRKKPIFLAIPPGVSDGCRIFLKGGGARGANGGANGDLVAILEIQRHPYFRKRGEDLYLEVPLTIWEALLGTRVRIPTVDGLRWVTVPPGTQSGEEMRMKDQGGPSLHGKGRGSQILIFQVVIPRDLNSGALNLLRELKRRNPGNPRKGCGWRTELENRQKRP